MERIGGIMLRGKYNIDLYFEQYIYYIKNGKLIKKWYNTTIGNSLENISIDETFEYIKKKKLSRGFIYLTNNFDTFFMSPCIEFTQIEECIFFEFTGIQVLLTEDETMDIYEFTPEEILKIETFFEKILKGKIQCQSDKWNNGSYLIKGEEENDLQSTRNFQMV